MLTPKFSLKQNADFLFIQLHVPFIKSENAECDVNEDEFYFSAKPYYLRLHLPGNVVNDDRLKSKYDTDKGNLDIQIPKEVPGQRFEGLNMLTKLLTPKHQLTVPDIQVVEQQSHSSEWNEIDTELGEEFSCDWFVEQKIPEEMETIQFKSSFYGFANKKNKVIGNICFELNMIDLVDPDNTPAGDRAILRYNQEEDKFDCEHFLADLFDDALIQDVISAEYPFLTGTCDDNEYSDKEKEKLMRLPRREYLIEKEVLSQVYLGLVDLVYAYSYNYRFCGGEHGIESDWTICKLSSTLSWFDSFTNLKDVIVSCARRSFCFPLYRSWKLFEKVLSDVIQIFKAGKKQILKCLLGIHSLLETSENHYPLNDLYITDYCVWIQSANCKYIESLSVSLQELKITKADVGFSIVDIEADAEKLMADCVSEDDEEVEELSKKMSNVVHVTAAQCSDSDDDEEAEDDDDDAEEEEYDEDSDGDDTTESCDECSSADSNDEEDIL